MSFVKWKSGGSSGGGSGPAAAASLAGHPDFTRAHLRDREVYRLGHLRSLGLQGEVTALAVDPVYSLMAVGTSTGLIHLLGKASFQCMIQLSTLRDHKPAAVKFLTFVPGAGRLCCIDEKNTLHVWNTGPGGMDDAKNQPSKEVTTSLYGEVTYVDVPSPAHSHLFFTLRDGVTLAYDVPRRHISPYRIENLWKQYEDRLRRSGVPGRFRASGTPEAVCCAMNPRDLNSMLIGYEGGVIQWDMKDKTAVNTFELTLPPGAPGGSSYTDQAIWTERNPAVTCVTFRPDGLVFAVGHEDGCISIWSLEEPDKPLMVRTLTKEDVNVTDAESLFDAGALDTTTKNGQPVPPAVREPIFKLAWASFPDRATLGTMVAAQSLDPGVEPVQKSTMQYAEKGETLLVVLGGCMSNDPPAINVLQMPVYNPPPVIKTAVAGPSEGLSIPGRKAYRESLSVTGITQYPTATPAEDFVLLPRTSPYFNLSFDPISIVIFLTPEDRLPPVKGPHGRRTVDAWSFPPPRSDLPPDDTGRKDFHTVTDEALQGYAMAAVPTLPNALSPGLSTSDLTSSWRLPWSSSPASPGLTPLNGGTITHHSQPARPLRLPSIFWTGGTNVLGCQTFSLDNATFRRLIAFGIETVGREEKPRLPLRGGTAVPDLHSNNAPDAALTKMEGYRILATWHADGAVRFWDVSPHILVMPSPLRFEYPSPLPHLTISITNLIKHPSLRHLPIARLFNTNPTRVRITGIDLAQATLECLVHLESGEVFIHKFGTTKEKPANIDNKPIPASAGSDQSYFEEAAGHDAYDGIEDTDQTAESLTSTAHLANWRDDGFKPVTILTTRRGPVVATAMSDIGFFAVSYYANSVVIVDLRGPDVLLREGFSEEGLKVKKKKKNSQNLPAESSSCLTLEWAICKMSGESHRAPRLIASYAKGLTKIYTLNSVLGEWVVDSKAATFTHDSLANPVATFMLSYATGESVNATAEALRQSMSLQNSIEQGSSKAEGKIPFAIWIVVAKRAIRAQLDFNGERIAKVDVVDGETIESAYIVRKTGNKILMAITSSGSALIYSLPTLEYINKVSLKLGSFDARPLGKLSVDPNSGDYFEYISPMEIHLRTIFHHRKPLLPRVDPSTVKHVVPAPPVPQNAAWGVSSWIWGGAPLTGAQLDALVAGPNRPPLPRAATAQKPPKSLVTWGEAPEPIVRAKAPAAPRRDPSTRDARERKDVYTEMTEAAEKRGDILEGLEDKMMAMGTAANDMLSEARKAAAKQSAKATAKGLFGF